MSTERALFAALLLAACGGGDKESGEDSASVDTPPTTATGTTGGGTATGTTSAPVVSSLAASVSATMATVVHVSWTTDVASTGVVEFGIDGALDRSTRPTASGTDHRTTLVGLPQDAEVSYRVVVDGGPGETQTVATGALPGAPTFALALRIGPAKQRIDTAHRFTYRVGNFAEGHADTIGFAFGVGQNIEPFFDRNRQIAHHHRQDRTHFDIDWIMIGHIENFGHSDRRIGAAR